MPFALEDATQTAVAISTVLKGLYSSSNSNLECRACIQSKRCKPSNWKFSNIIERNIS